MLWFQASGDRGHVLVDVPAPVVPYVPPVTHSNRRHQQVQGVQLPETKTSPRPKSADFASFETAKTKRPRADDVIPVTEYHETDRIDVPSLLPGSQRPHGTTSVVHGTGYMMPDTEARSKELRAHEMAEYPQYDGEFEYYYDDEYYYDEEPSEVTVKDDVVPALVKLWQETQ